MQTIEIIISPSGQTRLETKGFAGAACRDASRFVEAALGQTIAEERTAAFYREADAVGQVNRLANGK